MQYKTIVIGDSGYELDKAFLEGAEAFNLGIPCNHNPYDDFIADMDSQEQEVAIDQWGYGHNLMSCHPNLLELKPEPIRYDWDLDSGVCFEVA